MKRIVEEILFGEVRGFRGVGIGILRGVLWMFSGIYCAAVQVMWFCYKTGFLPRCGLDRPVISVGNLTWGGAGKTPLVILIAEFLITKGLKPAVLMRGYKGKDHSGEIFNDEAILLKEALGDVPIIVGKNRFQSAHEALKKTAIDVFILDDGFQHRQLKRDCDVVVVNATNPWGNGYLIPRGNLREPLQSLARADMFVITKSDMGQDRMPAIQKELEKFKKGPLIETIHQPVLLQDLNTLAEYELTAIRGKSIGALCGIGDPGSFTATLDILGGQLRKVFSFEDHHWYRKDELRKIISDCCKDKIAFLITTAKDAAKLREYRELFSAGPQCLVLKMKIQITKGSDEFYNRVAAVLQR